MYAQGLQKVTLSKLETNFWMITMLNLQCHRFQNLPGEGTEGV